MRRTMERYQLVAGRQEGNKGESRHGGAVSSCALLRIEAQNRNFKWNHVRRRFDITWIVADIGKVCLRSPVSEQRILRGNVTG